MKKQGINIKGLKNEDIGRWVEYEYKPEKIKKKGRLVSWNTVNAFCNFNVKANDPYINLPTTPVNPAYLTWVDPPITAKKVKKEDEE